MTDYDIALDLEGVLADTQGWVVDESDVIDESHVQSWGFEDDLYDVFMDTAHEAWSRHWDEIEPTEQFLSAKVAELRVYGTVDLVTNRHGVDDNIRKWLNKHDIEVETVHSNPAGTKKSEMEYDLYIDDNPHMVDDPGHLYLYDQPWNQNVSTDGAVAVRIESIADVGHDLALDTTVGDLDG